MSDCTIVITDSNGNIYTTGDYILVGTQVTITATPTDTTKNQVFLFQVNGADVTNGSTITIDNDITITALYWDGVNYPFLPKLSDNSYQMIAQCCRLGLNSTTWTLGDTFPLTLTNGDTITIRYCDDKSGRYNYTDGSGGTNAVFEVVELIRLDSSHTTFRFNPSNNTDDNGCYNNWNISELRERLNNGDLWNLLPYDFKEILKPVNIPTAKNGNNGTIVYTSDKLFLPAEREMFSSRNYSRKEEWNALGSQFTLYANNNTNAFRVKRLYGTTDATYYWERSPRSDYSNFVCLVNSSGGAYYGSATSSFGVAPCFAL